MFLSYNEQILGFWGCIHRLWTDPNRPRILAPQIFRNHLITPAAPPWQLHSATGCDLNFDMGRGSSYFFIKFGVINIHKIQRCEQLSLPWLLAALDSSLVRCSMGTAPVPSASLAPWSMVLSVIVGGGTMGREVVLAHHW